MPSYDAVRRRLIVCCDGTWQSSVSGERNIPSNVTRMCRHLARSQVVQEKNETTGQLETVYYSQEVFYDPGIGTGDLSEADVTRQGGTGAGLAVNVIEAYNWLVLNYQSGDKIYIFGFSRGAYTARALAGFVAELGICSPLDMMFFPVVYDLYEGALYPEADEDTQEIRDARIHYETMKKDWESGISIRVRLGNDALGDDMEINTGPRQPIDPKTKQLEVVGVWDTVGSLGVPKIGGWLKLPTFLSGLDAPGRQFHDVRISNNIRHAFHAVALDERRRPFSPTLWYVPKGTTRPAELSLKQVWFPGVHINCGGGSDDILKDRQSDCEQIANITFSWMVQQVRDFLAFDEASLKKSMEDQQRLLEKLRVQYQMAHAKSGWAVGDIIDSFTEASVAIKLGGSRWRSPGETWQPENIVDKTEQRTTKLGTTFEEIHPCVFYRMQQLNKRSPALEGFKRQACKDPKQGWEWVKKTVDEKNKPLMLVLPEYRITPHDSDPSKPRNLERLLADYNGATGYLNSLDEMYTSGVDRTKPDTYKTLSI